MCFFQHCALKTAVAEFKIQANCVWPTNDGGKRVQYIDVLAVHDGQALCLIQKSRTEFTTAIYTCIYIYKTALLFLWPANNSRGVYTTLYDYGPRFCLRTESIVFLGLTAVYLYCTCPAPSEDLLVFLLERHNNIGWVLFARDDVPRTFPPPLPPPRLTQNRRSFNASAQARLKTAHV